MEGITAAGMQRTGERIRTPAARVSGLVGLGSREIISFISAAKTNLGTDSGDQTGQLSKPPPPTSHHPPVRLHSAKEGQNTTKTTGTLI